MYWKRLPKWTIVFHRTLGKWNKIYRYKDGLASDMKNEWYFGDTYTGEFKRQAPGGGTNDGQIQTEKVGQKVDGYEHFTGHDSNYVGEWKNESLSYEFTLGLKVKI